jgi:hypothetical protein
MGSGSEFFIFNLNSIFPSINVAYPSPVGFVLRVVLLGVDHPALLGRTFLPGASALGLAFLFFQLGSGLFSAFQLTTEFGPSLRSISRLRPAGLTTHFDSGGPVPQPNRGGRFVDFLASSTHPFDKSLIHLISPNA